MVPIDWGCAVRLVACLEQVLCKQVQAAVPELRGRIMLQPPVPALARDRSFAEQGDPVHVGRGNSNSVGHAAALTRAIADAVAAVAERRHVLFYFSTAALTDPLVLALMSEVIAFEQQVPCCQPSFLSTIFFRCCSLIP